MSRAASFRFSRPALKSLAFAAFATGWPALAGCGGVATPQAAAADQAGASAATSASVTPAGSPSSSATASVPGAPPAAECNAFMDVVARTTTLRASIQREAPDAAKAAEWLARTAELSTQAKALPLTQPDLIIESANLATRLSDLSSDLRALAAAEKGADPVKKGAAHKKVLGTSEQVEVLTREPAARCSGDPKALQAQSGRLSASKVAQVISDHFPDFRKCYEAGLKRDPKLNGRVTVSFVIALDGKVTNAASAAPNAANTADIAPPSESTAPPMADKKVVECVVNGFASLQFPKPDGGTVSVVYPIVLSSAPAPK